MSIAHLNGVLPDRKGIGTVTRREFVAAVAAMALAGPRLAAAAGAAVGRVSPRLAFQVYGVRDLCAKDLVGTLKAAKAMGYEGVETGRFYGRDAADWKALCADTGLELVALQLYPHVLVEPELGKTIRFCHESGCRRINTAWFKGSAENANDWQLVANVLNHAVDVCAREGIEIGYHNHDQEFRTEFEGKTALAWLYERFDPRVRQEFDPGWCVLAGGDPLAWLKAHPGRNPTMHVMPAIDEKAGAVLKPGEAHVGSASDRADWKAFLPAAARDGVKWLVVKPTAHPDSLADLRGSMRFLRQHAI